MEELFNRDAEQAVLGAILVEPERLDDCILQAEHFTAGPHQKLMKTLRDLQSKDINIDLVTISSRLKDRPEHLEALGGIGYLAELSQSFVTLNNFETYCDIVLDFWRQREQMRIGLALMNGLDRTMAMQQLEGLEKFTDGKEDEGDIMDDLVEMYDDIESAGQKRNSIPSGYRDIDQLTLGFHDGDLIVLAARPSVGKTALALNIASNAVETSDHPEGDIVAIFSAEMKRKLLLRRMSGSTANIDLQVLRQGAPAFADSDWSKLTMAMGVLGSAARAGSLKIFDKAGMDTRYINKKLRKIRRDNPGRKILVIVDYLQLLQGDAKHQGNRMQEISSISMDLKNTASEFDVPVIALSQLSRKVEERADKRPMMSDLRESGQIEQDADVIGFLYREDYYDKETEDRGMIEVIFAKQREGATGTAKLAFVKEFGKFVTIDWSSHANYEREEVVNDGE